MVLSSVHEGLLNKEKLWVMAVNIHMRGGKLSNEVNLQVLHDDMQREPANDVLICFLSTRAS